MKTFQILFRQCNNKTKVKNKLTWWEKIISELRNQKTY